MVDCSGSKVSVVDCWRPSCTSPISELRRFFIGGSPELEDPTYSAVPSAFEVDLPAIMRFQGEKTNKNNNSSNKN